MSTAVITPAPTNFAEFEAGGGKYSAPAAVETAKPETQTEETSGAAADAAETETAAEPVQKTTQEKPAEPQKGAEKRTLTSERDKLLAEVTDLRKQRRELQDTTRTAPEAQPAKQAEPAKVEDKAPARPKLTDFDGNDALDKYEAALAKYDDDRDAWRERRAEAKVAESRAKEQQDKLTRDYAAQVEEHIKEHPEYDEEIGKTPLSDLMVSVILHHGPALGQVFIDNKAEAARISKLPRDTQIFEMGRALGSMKAPAAAEPDTPESQETTEPVKVPAKLGATGGGSPAGKNPKNFAEYEAAQSRLNQKRK
jgi:hypothetical protein